MHTCDSVSPSNNQSRPHTCVGTCHHKCEGTSESLLSESTSGSTSASTLHTPSSPPPPHFSKTHPVSHLRPSPGGSCVCAQLCAQCVCVVFITLTRALKADVWAFSPASACVPHSGHRGVTHVLSTSPHTHTHTRTHTHTHNTCARTTNTLGAQGDTRARDSHAQGCTKPGTACVRAAYLAEVLRQVVDLARLAEGQLVVVKLPVPTRQSHQPDKSRSREHTTNTRDQHKRPAQETNTRDQGVPTATAHGGPRNATRTPLEARTRPQAVPRARYLPRTTAPEVPAKRLRERVRGSRATPAHAAAQACTRRAGSGGRGGRDRALHLERGLCAHERLHLHLHGLAVLERARRDTGEVEALHASASASPRAPPRPPRPPHHARRTTPAAPRPPRPLQPPPARAARPWASEQPRTRAAPFKLAGKRRRTARAPGTAAAARGGHTHIRLLREAERHRQQHTAGGHGPVAQLLAPSTAARVADVGKFSTRIFFFFLFIMLFC